MSDFLICKTYRHFHVLIAEHSLTVNSEIFMGLLFSQIALKDIFAMLEDIFAMLKDKFA